MPNVSKVAEAFKIANETRFATIGRAIADAVAGGLPTTKLVEEAQLRRRQEQESADRMTQFAALARQVGDAASSGRDTAPLLARLIELRRREVAG